ncbi:hypothetical protein H257_01853 [Aphanomyces astaci]|uniref:Uncharacterized protein n=1 Tax=Aphanomyces astaci TaxID=112090 RepID=W4H437_APHAT|nr:hypothetical protein H257_01853 [Aphanomyces astaci]ETV86770.1 hypothetical protein H257_01853 [Aphanomyces astaci]|eukprot:XP_009823569.1 hypothetical protein H257_01853 [Aphanomyces astaci]
MEAAPMEPNERTKVSANGKAKKKSTTTASTKGKVKLKAPPRTTATVQQLPNTAADGEQSPPDAGSEALRELLQRIKLAYPSDSDDETKDDLMLPTSFSKPTFLLWNCLHHFFTTA